MDYEKKLKELNISLPEPPKAVASYVPVRQSGNTLYISGQIPIKDGVVVTTGKVIKDCTIEEATEAAKLCAINILANIKEHTGDLNRVKAIIKLTGYVNCLEDFYQSPAVINGASNLFVDIFGDAGKHARAAVGVAQLPLNATVEVDAIVELL